MQIFDLGENSKSKAQNYFISNQNNVDVLTGDDAKEIESIPLNNIKKNLRDDLTKIITAKPNARVYIDYFTSSGWVTNGELINVLRQKNAVKQSSIDEKINKLMSDPKINSHLPSGEQNNNLNNKEIYGVRIHVI